MCQALGLIDDDKHLHKALQEASTSQSAHQLRKLFALIINSCEPAEPISLWNAYKDDLTEDLEHHNYAAADKTQIHNQCLAIIEDHILSIGGSSLPK